MESKKQHQYSYIPVFKAVVVLSSAGMCTIEGNIRTIAATGTTPRVVRVLLVPTCAK